jgi:hypothetical protein
MPCIPHIFLGEICIAIGAIDAIDSILFHEFLISAGDNTR